MIEKNLLEDIATSTELTRYADVLVNCALGHGHGIEKGDVVLVGYSQSGALLLPYLQASITKAGGHLLHEPDISFPPKSNPNTTIANLGTREQINFFPLAHKKALYELADHKISLYTDEFIHKIDIDSEKISDKTIERTRIINQLISLKTECKNIFKSYSIAYMPSQPLAANSNVTLAVFWQQLVQACFLDEEDAVERCRQTLKQTKVVEDALNAMSIRHLRLHGQDCDLTITLTPEARFRSSAGGNMPSYECFVTPAASQTEGFIRFSYPLIYKGHTIEEAEVHFKDGEVTNFTAGAGLEAFTSLLDLPGMKRLGEFALTDKRLSRIDTVLPSAKLFLENIGGTAHVAFGSGYKKCFVDKNITPDCNEASDHQDMVIGGDFTVTATAVTGEKIDIFKNGQFTFF